MTLLARLVAVVLAAPLLVACGAASGPASPGSPGPQVGAASCAALTPRQRLRGAHIVAQGTMLPGRTEHGILVSPARMRVARYVKGGGPAVVTVSTSVPRPGVIAEDGIAPHPGERWTIFSDSRHPPLATSICSGSRLGFARLPHRRVPPNA